MEIQGFRPFSSTMRNINICTTFRFAWDISLRDKNVKIQNSGDCKRSLGFIPWTEISSNIQMNCQERKLSYC